MTDSEKTYRWPANLAACADRLLLLRERAQTLQLTIASKTKAERKKLEILQLEDKALEEHLIDNLPKSDALGITGKRANALITKTPVPTIKDWDKLCAWVKRGNHFDVLQHRVTVSAVRDRWEAKQRIPGLEVFNVVKLKLSKLN